MEPINVKINVTVEFGQKTADLLRSLIKSDAPAAAAVQEPKRPVSSDSPAPAPASEPDMPDFTANEPANEPAKEITDANLRQIVKEAKDRAGAKPIRAVFAEMGIASSVECPQERRSELVAKLRKL